MTRTAPHPGFLPGEKVTLHHATLGPLRLVVTHTEPTPAGSTPWVVATTPDGYGRYRRPATDFTRGWGN